MAGGGRGLATVLAVVVVLSMVAPATVAAGTPDRSVRAATGVDADQARANPGDTSGGAAQIAGSGSNSVGDDALPIVRKLAAIRAVRNLSTNGHGGLANHVSRAERRFNGTLSAYSDARRLRESGAFTDDAVGVRALAHFNGTNQSDRAKRAADLVFEADNESARTAVADARRVLNRFGDAMDNPGQRRSAQSHLQTAERALDRAERAREKSTEGRKYWGARADALTQLRTAHRHAHMVMRFVDREAGAQVTITSTEDPVRNGSVRTQYVVSGTVTAPRPATVGNVTVSVNGGPAVTAQTAARSVAPGENLSFAAPVNLTDRVNEIEVRVAGDDGGNGQGNDPPSGGAGQQASVTLRLDGDGLSEDVETGTLGTDPLDPDSDASATAVDEADDGVIDGREDFDGDNLTTLRELELGTDPLAADTDGDGLEDGEELIFTGTDPLASDSDGDGTDDGAEDPDGDGLTNVEEVEAGTFTDLADSDGDGLDDPAEMDAGTDPLAYDTDDDGLQDGDELREAFGTDPLDEDTDGDGVLDGNETYTTTATNESLGATVSLTGQGNVAETASIENASANNVRLGKYGPPKGPVRDFVDVEADADFETATVSLTYDESAVSDPSDLAIYRYNETSRQFERLASTVDPANNTVSASTDHFSAFSMFDVTAWEAWIESRDPEALRGSDRLERIPISQLALRVAYGNRQAGDLGLYYFDDFTAPTPSGGSEVLDDFEDGDVDEWTQTGFNPETTWNVTDTAVGKVGKFRFRGDRQGHQIARRNISSPRLVNGTYSVRVKASSLTDDDFHVRWRNPQLENTYFAVDFTRETTGKVHVFLRNRNSSHNTRSINIGKTMPTDVWHEIAFEVTDPVAGEGHVTITNTEANTTFFERDISFDVAFRNASGDLTDTDGDGIPDFAEERGLPLNNGPRINTDPFDADTDGDGMLDGEEVKFKADPTETGFEWRTLPTDFNTDNDRLPDPVEQEGWEVNVTYENGQKQRFDPDSTATALYRSDPTEVDSDGDGLSDFTEKTQTMTDPMDEVTYSITEEHEETLETVFGDRISVSEATTARKMGLLRDDLDFDVTNPDLTDATDDSDLVIDNSAAGLDQFDVLALGGSDRTDYWLSNEHEITQYNFSPIGGSPAYLYERTDPWVSDTDGDGLTDGQEYNGLGVIASGSRYVYTTDPTLRDTDSDRLEDLAELRFGSDPRAKNIDNDQFSDFTDPAPYTENIPPTPQASFKQGALLGEIVWVGASDDSGVEEVRAIYEYETAAGGTEDAIYVFHPDGATEFEDRASPPAGVANLTIQASDVHGNAYGVTIRIGGDGTGQALSSDVALAAGGAFGAAATNPIDELALSAGGGVSLGTAAVGLGVGIVVVGGVLGVVHVYDVATTEATTETYEVPLFATPGVASYQNGDIHLREGFARTSGEFTRGYGWAYIQATSSVTQAEIEQVLNNGREVTQGEVTFVIGEGLSGEEKIILTIIGGTLMAAASSSTVEDPCNDIVNVEKHGDHATRNGKPVDDISTLRQLIKDEVVKIIDVAGKRYYITKFRGEFVLISAKGGPGYWIVSTILTSDAINNLFKTIEDATDQINGDKETVYDPKNGIDC